MVFPPATGTSRRRSPVQPLQRLFRAIGRRRLTRATAPLFSRFNPAHRDEGKGHQHLAAADKRRHSRICLADTTVKVTDGCLFATALIDNISPRGICLRNLPEQLYRSAGQLTVFSSDNPGIPILHIQPRWENTGWGGKTIGTAILNASGTWRLFFVHAAGHLEV